VNFLGEADKFEPGWVKEGDACGDGCNFLPLPSAGGGQKILQIKLVEECQ